MAFYVSVLERNQTATRKYEWHISEPKPDMGCGDAFWFQADGDELEQIRSRFEGIPITKGNICMWSGKMAEFILNNL